MQTWDTCDSYGRFRVRLNEMWESLKIVEQAADRLAGLEGAPVMVADKKIAWPSQLAIGSDGMGNSLDHIRHIMGESMEALIHHFKLVTEGFRVPAGQAYVPIESPRGELGAHVVSDGGTRPFRAHFRDPSFTNLQATSVMSEGGMVADVIVAIASHRPRDGRRRPVSQPMGGAVADETYGELARSPPATPRPASGLLPMLHLVQSVEGRITPEGIEACADILDISAAEVSGVATFYTMYKRKPGRRLPRRRLHQHAVRGDGRRRDLRAAQGPPRRRQRRDHRGRQGHPRARRVQRGLRLRAGDDGQLGVHGQHDPGVGRPARRRPARGQGGHLDPRPARVHLATRPSGCSPASPTAASTRAPAAGPASLVGLAIARERGWTAPDSGSGRSAGRPSKAEAAEQGAHTPAEASAVEEPSTSAETAAEQDEAQ